MKLKISIVCERMLLGFGADLVYHKLAEGLQKKGYYVTVFTCRSDGTYNNYGYKINCLPLQANRDFHQYEKDASRFSHCILSEDPDLVILGTFPFYSFAPTISKYVPCIAVDHGICSTEGMSASVIKNFNYMRKTQYGAYFKSVEKIITVSDYLKINMPAAYKDKTLTIYNGIDHFPETPSSEGIERFRANHGIYSNDILLLYVGRLNPRIQPYKGTSEIMELFKRLRGGNPKIKMIMAGFGDSADESLIRSQGILPIINAPANLMPVLYNACDIYVTASKWEGFNLPLLEAQAAGKPAVALRIGAHPEVVKDGETSFLTDDIEEMYEKIVFLVNSKDKRGTMGKKAAEWALNFKWDEKIDQYIKIIKETASKINISKRTESKVSAIILNYNAEFDLLDECVRTLKAQTYNDLEIIIVDNNSTNGSIEYITKRFDGLKTVRLNQNLGFSVGINRGVKKATGEFVLLLNFDIKLSPDAIEEMVKVIKQKNNTIAVAPKILFYRDPEIIESIGNAITPNGDAFNLGIGQIDIGQYDVSERVFGACFAAALIRKKAFNDDCVGKLEERFFMYYEDVDWNYRANALGYKIITAPKAVIYHHHSAAAKKFSYDVKYELIQLNLLRMVLQNIQGRDVVLRLIINRIKSHIINMIRKHYRRASLKVILKFLRDIPLCIKKRNELKKRRIINDEDIFKYSFGELPYYDPVVYSPIKSLDSLELIYTRKNIIAGTAKTREILNFIRLLKFNKIRFERDFCISRLDELLKDEPERIKSFYREIIW